MRVPSRILFVVLVFALILLFAFVVLGGQVGTFLGSTVASNVLLIALIIVDAFVGLYAILEQRTRSYLLQVKGEVLEKWDARGNLGGVREDTGEFARTDPADPPAFIRLPPKIQSKFKRAYPELWQAWEEAKKERLLMTARLEDLYLQLQRRVQAIRDEIPIPEMDVHNPQPPYLISKKLLHAVLEEARHRGRGDWMNPWLTDDPSSGTLVQFGQIVVSGATEGLQALEARLEVLFKSQEFGHLAAEIVHLESEMPTSREVPRSPRLKAFEEERSDVIQRIAWKHPAK